MGTYLRLVIRVTVKLGNAVSPTIQSTPVVLVLVQDAHHPVRSETIHKIFEVIQETCVEHAGRDLNHVPHKAELQDNSARNIISSNNNEAWYSSKRTRTTLKPHERSTAISASLICGGSSLPAKARPCIISERPSSPTICRDGFNCTRACTHSVAPSHNNAASIVLARMVLVSQPWIRQPKASSAGHI